MKLSLRNAGYGSNGTQILEPLDLEFASGTKTVLLGPNGAGKTTLLRLLSGFFPSDSGEVELDGRSIRGFQLADRSRCMAVLTQQNSLDFPFTAREVVAMGRIPYGRTSDGDHVVDEVLSRLRLDGDRIYTTLSGGERQLVHIGRVLAQIWGQGAGACLLLDEPTAALDLKRQQLVVSILKDLSGSGITEVIVIHDVNLAAELADKIVLLSDGKVIASGEREAVLNVANLEVAFGVPMQELVDSTTRRTFFLSRE